MVARIPSGMRERLDDVAICETVSFRIPGGQVATFRKALMMFAIIAFCNSRKKTKTGFFDFTIPIKKTKRFFFGVPSSTRTLFPGVVKPLTRLFTLRFCRTEDYLVLNDTEKCQECKRPRPNLRLQP